MICIDYILSCDCVTFGFGRLRSVGMKYFIIFLGLLSIIICSKQPTLASDQTSSIIANQQVFHIVEDSPSCSGIAPQKTQNADLPLKASTSMKGNAKFLQSSKTEMNPQRVFKELSGRVKHN